MDINGYDVEAHSMSHKNLGEMSQKKLTYEISQSKNCLSDKGIGYPSLHIPEPAFQIITLLLTKPLKIIIWQARVFHLILP